METFEHRLKEEARRSYELSVQVWASLAATGATKQKRPPEAPAILKD